MSESLADYIANIIASALLANGDETNNNILRDEHINVVKRILED